MDFKLILDAPWYFLFFCIIAGLAYAFVLYRKHKFDKSGRISTYPAVVMASLRFFSVALIAFLLLSPFLRTLYSEVERPIVLIVADNTRSIMLNKDSTYYRDTFPKQISNLYENLSADFDARFYRFDSELERENQMDFSGAQTDISSVLHDLSGIYYNRNIGAVILATDGIYNQGVSPLSVSSQLNAPIYTVAMGDTLAPRDIVLQDVSYNQVVYLHNDFQLRLHISATEAAGEETTVNAYRGDSLMKSVVLRIDDNRFDTYIDLILTADKAGMTRYHLEVEGIEDEISYVNNDKDIFIDVIDSRSKVLMLSAAPHPDIGAIRNALNRNEQYEVDVFTMDEKQLTESQWLEKLEAYNLVIAHQLPGRGVQSTQLFSALGEVDLPVWFILGENSDIRAFNGLETGINIEGQRFADVFPLLNDNFGYFYLDDASAMFERKPPLLTPQGEVNISEEHDVLLTQRIGNVETQRPLFSFVNIGRQKYAVLLGEGVWRWFLHDFREQGSHRNMDDLVLKTTRYLSLREDRRQFRMHQLRDYYDEDEAVRFEAEVYNEAFQHVRDAEVKMEIIDEEGREYNFTFHESGERYHLNAGTLPPGFYEYESSVEIAGTTHRATGSFVVAAVEVEYLQTIANHGLLLNIAESSGGLLKYPRQTAELYDIIKNREDVTSVTYMRSDMRELIHTPLLFFMIIVLLTTEWVFRKFYGSY